MPKYQKSQKARKVIFITQSQEVSINIQYLKME